MQISDSDARDATWPRVRRHQHARLAVLWLAMFASTAGAGELQLSWIGDFASVVDGGLRQGERHLGLVELAYEDEFQLGDRVVALYGSAQHVYGGGLSCQLVGDLQVVSNIDADDGTRVLEAWVDVPLSDAWSLKLGRYDLNSEFDVIDPAGLFLNSSQGIGADIAQTGAAGPSIFPHTAFAIRLGYAPGERHTVRAVALDVESDPNADRGDTPFLGGTMLALEYEFGQDDTRWTAGAWTFTTSRDAISSAQSRDREYGAYGSVEQRIGRDWATYLRFGVANERASRLQAYAGGGVVYEGGLLPGRADVVGLAIAHARNGDAYRDAMREAGVATTAAETAIELTWRVPLGAYVVLQPDLQYVIDPDTDPAIDDALVAILRVEVAFGF
jgi:porin